MSMKSFCDCWVGTLCCYKRCVSDDSDNDIPLVVRGPHKEMFSVEEGPEGGLETQELEWRYAAPSEESEGGSEWEEGRSEASEPADPTAVASSDQPGQRKKSGEETGSPEAADDQEKLKWKLVPSSEDQ